MLISGQVRLSKGYLCPARLGKSLEQGPVGLGKGLVQGPVGLELPQVLEKTYSQ